MGFLGPQWSTNPCQVHLLPSANRPPHDGFFNVPNLRLLQLWTRMCRNERLGFNDCQTTTSQAGTTSYPENKTRLSEEKLKGRARGSRGQATRACRKFPYPHKRHEEAGGAGGRGGPASWADGRRGGREEEDGGGR